MTSVGASQFCMVGRFISFLPGEKSPYQGISLAVLQGDSRSQVGSKVALKASKASVLAVRHVVLSKQLRRMIYRYLAPQDWVRVVGKQAFDKQSGQLAWKATEISKLSTHQAERLTRQLRSPARSQAPVSVSGARVLVCQGSSCRRRGSLAVENAIARHLSEKENLSEKESFPQCTVQPTGCMKRCKQGPNVVLPSGDSYDHVTVEQVRSLFPLIMNAEL